MYSSCSHYILRIRSFARLFAKGVVIGYALLAGGNLRAQSTPSPVDPQQRIQQLYEETFGTSPQALEARAKAKKESDEKVKKLRQTILAQGETILRAMKTQPAAHMDEAARQLAHTRAMDFLSTRNSLLKASDILSVPLPAVTPSPAPSSTVSPTPSPTASPTPSAAPLPGTLLERLEEYQETTESLPVYPQQYLAQSPLFTAELSSAAGLTAQEQVYLQVALWHQVALDLTALDHTKQPPNSPPIKYTPFERQGPVRSSRVLALSHLASFEPLNIISRRYDDYKPIAERLAKLAANHPNVPATINDSTVSSAMAVAQANFDVLKEEYPSKLLFLKEIMDVVTVSIIDTPAKLAAGKALGSAIATEIINGRALDKSNVLDPSVDNFSKLPDSQWHSDPLNPGGATLVAYGALWQLVTPFVLDNANQFRPAAPPDVHSEAFKDAYDDVKIKGGDYYADPTVAPVNERASTDTNRTGYDRTSPDFEAVGTETFVGKFWAYDGTPYLCAPPRLYNMIASSLAYRERKITDPLDYARYLALINLALADAAIAGWEAKYYWLYPRPVTGIRYAAKNAAQLGLSFPTAADKKWTPLGAQVTNTSTQNFTPNFPSYPSGHAVFGGAMFQVLRRLNGVTGRSDYTTEPRPGSDDSPAVDFTFLSDEYNGLNVDPSKGEPRPRLPQKFNSFAQAEWDNGRSRVFLGIHWKFDAIVGIHQGNQIGDYVFDHALQPLKSP